jgi:hypothetical protein
MAGGKAEAVNRAGGGAQFIVTLPTEPRLATEA